MICGRRDDKNISVSDDSSYSHGQNLLYKMELKCTKSLKKLLHRPSLQTMCLSLISLAFDNEIDYFIYTKIFVPSLITPNESYLLGHKMEQRPWRSCCHSRHPKRTSWLVLDVIIPKATVLNVPESYPRSWF